MEILLTLKAVKLMVDKGQYEEAYALIKTIEDPDFETSAVEILIMEGLQQFDILLQQASNLNKKAQSDIEVFLSLIILILCQYRLENYNDVNRLIAEIKQNPLYEDHTFDIFWQIMLHKAMAMYYQISGSIFESLEEFYFTFNLTNNINEFQKSVHLINLGEAYFDLEQYDKALNYFQDARRQSLEEANDLANAFANYDMGKVLNIKGEYDAALEHLFDGIEMFTTLQRMTGVILCLDEMGVVKFKQGKIQEARSLLMRALDYSLEFNFDVYNAITLNKLGRLELTIGDINIGIGFLNQSIEIWRRIGNLDEVNKASFYLLNYMLENNLDSSDLSKYEKIFNDTLIHTKSELSQYKQNYIKGLKAKNGSTIQERAMAQQIFESLNQEHVDDFDLELGTMLNLLEVKLFELKTFETDIIKMEIIELLDQIGGLIENSGLVPLKIEMLFLRTKFAFIIQDFTKVEEYLQEATDLSDELDDNSLSYRHKKIRESIERDIDSWQKLMQNLPKLREQIDQIHLLDYLKDVSRVLKDIN